MTTPLGTFLSSQAQPGTFQPACLQGWRAHGWLWSQALGQRPSKLPSHCQPDAEETPEDSGAGVTPPVPRDLWSPQSASQHPPPRETLPQGLLSDSPGQQQCRPVHRRDPSCRCPAVAHGVPLPEGAQRGLCVLAQCLIRAEHTCCPSAHRLLQRRGQAVLAKCRPREPEAHNVESGKKTGSTAGHGPGLGIGREDPWGPRVPTPEPTGPALGRKLRTAWTCPPAGRLLCGLGSPGERTGALQTALQPRQGAVWALRPPPGRSLGPPPTHEPRPLGRGLATLPCRAPLPQTPRHRPHG